MHLHNCDEQLVGKFKRVELWNVDFIIKNFFYIKLFFWLKIKMIIWFAAALVLSLANYVRLDIILFKFASAWFCLGHRSSSCNPRSSRNARRRWNSRTGIRSTNFVRVDRNESGFRFESSIISSDLEFSWKLNFKLVTFRLQIAN